MSYPAAPDASDQYRLKVYLLHGDDAARKIVHAMLESLGHDIVLSTSSSSELMDRLDHSVPDMVIVGAKLNATGSHESRGMYEILNELKQHGSSPAIALIPPSEVDRARRLMNDQVMGVLVEPASAKQLRPAIHLARLRFLQTVQLQQRADDLTLKLDQTTDAQRASVHQSGDQS